MRIALDAMGGDDAPRAMVQGAIDYARAFPAHQVLLVGREHDIRSCLRAEKRGDLPNLLVEDAPEVIGMAEKISALKERPNDSMNRCAQLVKKGRADALVLCGNTGCSVAAAQLHLRRIPGIKRAGILTPLPKPSGFSWAIDCGANAEGRPEHLVQFAEMTAAFLKSVHKIENPGVGVLSNGEEEEKGNELTRETLALLRQTDLRVLGHIEGHHIYSRADLDIVVCDGFTGNIMLKASEGVEAAMRRIIKEEIGRRWYARVGGLFTKPAFNGVKRRIDWRYVGGCVLLGVDGVCIIGHGRSNRVAVYHALLQAAGCVEGQMIERLRERFRLAGSAAESA